MRDRLIELLEKGQPPFNPLNDVCIGKLADYLLANGVIVPKCKVGEKVWVIPSKDSCGNILENITEMECIGYFVNNEHYVLKLKSEKYGLFGIDMEREEQLAFTSKEVAEQALKGGEWE